MRRSRSENEEKSFLFSLFLSYIPNPRDNVKQLILKLVFLLSLVTFILSAIVLSSVFVTGHHQSAVLEETRNIWYTKEDSNTPVTSPFDALKAENSDFKGWIKIDGTEIDHPFYQATDDSYYLDHNGQKEKSKYGALFLRCENVISSQYADQNLVIYGHNMKDGTMFGSLKKLRSLPFYQQHSTIELSTEHKKSIYRIYAVFLLNARKADDNGYIYNISRTKFLDEADFEGWVTEAKQRSFFQTDVEVNSSDSILTLVTCASDFKDARLVVMARELQEDESQTDMPNAAPNPSPRYPKRWYDDKKIPYPYTGGNNDVS